MANSHDFDFNEAWRKLTTAQKRYVRERPEHQSKKATADALGMSAHTVYGWPDYVEEVAGQLIQHEIEAGQSELRSNLMQAVQTIAETMAKADSEHARLDAARYIADQVLGKATQSQKVEMNAQVEGINVSITGDGADPDIE